jgi:hypothetical protein
MAVNGASVTLPSGSSSLAAIDTGTTLIGGPASQVAAVYAAIPGSAPATGNFDGYYTYRTSHRPWLSLAAQYVDPFHQPARPPSASHSPLAVKPGPSLRPISNCSNCRAASVSDPSSRSQAHPTASHRHGSSETRSSRTSTPYSARTPLPSALLRSLRMHSK